ncbi:MAG: hypothetical protein Q7S76_00130 [bacterium]|nr:hypothetical protein [bacterium]
MEQEKIEQIIAQLADHEARLKQLEGGVRSAASSVAIGSGDKQKTLREVVKGVKFKNGQEQVAAIVGYHEKILGQPIQKEKIKEEWAGAKMNGTYSPMYFSRAKDTLIRVLNGGTCDLTQTGEEFFDRLLKNESADATSK